MMLSDNMLTDNMMLSDNMLSSFFLPLKTSYTPYRPREKIMMRAQISF
jgi:hypothetical protein